MAFGGFWHSLHSQDAVLHFPTDYYSNLFRFKGQKLREFLTFDYLNCFNSKSIVQPININRENGIFGYRNTLFNNFQRLNLSAQTNYYSPISIYGFKFNFYLLLQASLLADSKRIRFQESVLFGFYTGLPDQK